MTAPSIRSRVRGAGERTEAWREVARESGVPGLPGVVCEPHPLDFGPLPRDLQEKWHKAKLPTLLPAEATSRHPRPVRATCLVGAATVACRASSSAEERALGPACWAVFGLAPPWARAQLRSCDLARACAIHRRALRRASLGRLGRGALMSLGLRKRPTALKPIMPETTPKWLSRRPGSKTRSKPGDGQSCPNVVKELLRETGLGPNSTSDQFGRKLRL